MSLSRESREPHFRELEPAGRVVAGGGFAPTGRLSRRSLRRRGLVRPVDPLASAGGGRSPAGDHGDRFAGYVEELDRYRFPLTVRLTATELHTVGAFVALVMKFSVDILPPLPIPTTSAPVDGTMPGKPANPVQSQNTCNSSATSPTSRDTGHCCFCLWRRRPATPAVAQSAGH
jgi:hypothetical protein